MDAPKITRERAKELRRGETPPEAVLWSRLRARRLKGLKFRRQHPFGPFVADFYCDEVRLVVELDGPHHHSQREYDARRDAYFAAEGIRTYRVEAGEVLKHLDWVLERIWQFAKEQQRLIDGDHTRA